MDNNGEKTLYLFIDESGNFDFSCKGTKYFVLSCLSTFQPIKEREKLLNLRYQLLDGGIDQEFFHATEDRQAVRNEVFSILNSFSNDIEIHSVVAQKNKANPSLYYEEYYKKGRIIKRIIGADFYQIICRTLLKYVFEKSDSQGAEKVVVVLGSIFTREKQSIVLKTLKNYLKGRFDKPFEIYFHQAKADLNCQLADYCGWAITIKWERNEKRPYDLIRDRVKSEYDIFEKGNVVYY
ncbi:DUF3800 domain-containing protein [Patescibacteria group bacterium]|nr:DUF3800 domain-containing protein [Patescibacteria group bacterium]